MGVTYRPTCSPRHRRWCSRAHADLVLAYRDARDARDALRESDMPVPASYAYGSAATCSQLEDDDFDAAFPRVTFRDWLVAHARSPE